MQTSTQVRPGDKAAGTQSRLGLEQTTTSFPLSGVLEVTSILKNLPSLCPPVLSVRKYNPLGYQLKKKKRKNREDF